MNNAIITGGAGFIASHLAEALRDRHDRIYLLDNLIRTNGLRNIEHLLADQSKYVFLKGDVSTFDFSTVEHVNAIYHLAATRINRCVHDPKEGHSFIADGGFNVVHYCAEHEIKLFFASTASVYNNPKRFPIRESDPCEPHTLYGSAKYYTEGLMKAFAKTHNLKYSICRFFSVYGERMDCEGVYTEIIYNWLNSINRGDNRLTVYGDPKEKTLDLVYVKDAVNAITKVTERWDNEVYNVSTETGTTIEELLSTITKVLGVTVSVQRLAENRTDIEKKRVGSTNKLKSIGWSPKYTLARGIKNTHEWISYLNGQS